MAGSRKRRRWANITVGTLLALVLVFYIGGGIVFSNMIYVDALTPQPPTPDHGVYITAVGDETITLSSPEEREDTTRPGIAGLSWDEGFGQIADIVETNGLAVTRRFALIEGTLPVTCSGPLASCDQVDIDSWVFPTDPADVELAFDEVIVPAPIGDLGAWRVPGGDGTVWAVHAHGWRAARREALRSLPTYNLSGVTSLVIDYRNDDGAPKDPSGIYRFGRSEWEDIEAAVDYAVNNGAERVILVGYSTGAALHLAFMERSDLSTRVAAMVFDSPNVDMGETVRYGATKRSIPGTSLPVPSSLTGVAMLIADLRWDVGWDEIDYVERAGQIITVPTLVYHGTEDDRVPIDVSRRLQDSVPDQVRLVETQGAGHVTSWNVDTVRYATTLTAFLRENGLTTTGETGEGVAKS